MPWIRCVALAIAILSLSSCGEKKGLAFIEAARDRLCACEDAACLQKEAIVFEGFKKELETLNDSDLEKAVKVIEEGLQCSVALAERLKP